MRPVYLGLALALMARPALAQPFVVISASQVSPPEKLPLVQMSVQPAAAPVPAMKYMLLPEVRDLKPGNAALGYQRAHSHEWWGNFKSSDHQKLVEWLEMPLKKLPREKLYVLAASMSEVDRAARLENCDWEMLSRVREAGFMTLLPDVQGFRTYGSMLALRSRMEMLDGKLDDAVYTFQTGLALGRHVGDQPILISTLVGVAISQITLDQIEEFVQQPGAPNLYWALHDLPRPFLDLRRTLQGEKVMLEAMFPGIRQALRDPKTPALSVGQINKFQEQLGMLEGGNNFASKVALAVMAARIHPKAKKHFLANGWTADQIEAMPVSQTALMYALLKYDEFYDDFYKWHNAPYWQARPQMKKWEERIREIGADPENMLARLLLPAGTKVFFARGRVDRRIAMLQTIEALRLHAAAHNGKLPEELDDIRDLSIPSDPMTGKAFQYTLSEGKATLYAPPPPGEAAGQQTVLRYELTILPSKKSSKE